MSSLGHVNIYQELQLKEAEAVISERLAQKPVVDTKAYVEIEALKVKLAEVERQAERYKTERNKMIKLLKEGSLKKSK